MIFYTFNVPTQINKVFEFIFLSKNKFSGLDIEEVRVFMEKIISVENYRLEDFKLKENLPGLFTIEYLK